jgi:RHS repeat-associated protein
MPQLREKLHQGLPSSNPALYLGFNVCKSTTVLGLRAAEHLERIRSRYTGKERDTESGNDYFGARYYASSMGRFMSPDPTPFGIAPGDPQSWNLYSYARNRPMTAIDTGGMWYTPLHKQMVDIALSGLMSAGEIAQLQHRQDVMDSHASDMNDQSGHYMAVPGQDPQQAKRNADTLIMNNISQASQGTDASGHMSSDALDHLGDAMHTLEDMTSPMHTTDDGTPRVWEGVGFLGHKGAAHWMGENEPSDSWARFGQAIRLTLAAFVQANSVGAAQHGITADNFEREANRRISDFVDREFIIKGDPIGEEAARQCAMGNLAACND